MFENMKEHPSYGMLGFSRVSHGLGGSALFGSSIQHKDTIVMRLKHGKVNRDLNRDWYFGEGVITEVEMSYSQFAEAITAMNVGDGIPVTIRYTEKDGEAPAVPFTSKMDEFEDEFKEHLSSVKAEAKTLVDEVRTIFDSKKSIGKGDRDEILKRLQMLESHIGGSSEFIYKQFNEQMEKTITEAKGEIEAFCQNKINSIAQAQLVEHKEEFTKLENPVDLPD